MLCQYKNIYTSLNKYLKGKKKTQTDYREKKNVATVATVPLGTVVTVQNLGKKNGSWNQSTVATML